MEGRGGGGICKSVSQSVCANVDSWRAGVSGYVPPTYTPFLPHTHTHTH